MLNNIREYMKNPKNVGSIMPSSRSLVRKMMEPIDFEKASCIMEYGPGTGAFTEELVNRKRSNTVLILIEQNEEFCRMLLERYGNVENLYVVNKSAEDADEIMREFGISRVDYIVSGLPFVSMHTAMMVSVFQATRRCIGRTGTFITLQYTTLRKKFFEWAFDIIDCVHVMKNLPPAYVFVLRSRIRMQTGGGSDRG